MQGVSERMYGPRETSIEISLLVLSHKKGQRLRHVSTKSIMKVEEPKEHEQQKVCKDSDTWLSVLYI